MYSIYILQKKLFILPMFESALDSVADYGWLNGHHPLVRLRM